MKSLKLSRLAILVLRLCAAAFFCVCCALVWPGLRTAGAQQKPPLTDSDVFYPAIDRVLWQDQGSHEKIYEHQPFHAAIYLANNAKVASIPVRFSVIFQKIGDNGTPKGKPTKFEYTLVSGAGTTGINFRGLPAGAYSIKVKQYSGVFQSNRVLVVYPNPPPVKPAEGDKSHGAAQRGNSGEKKPETFRRPQQIHVPIVDLEPGDPNQSAPSSDPPNTATIAPGAYFTVEVTLNNNPSSKDDGAYTISSQTGANFTLSFANLKQTNNWPNTFIYELSGYATTTGKAGDTPLTSGTNYTITLDRPCDDGTSPCQARSFTLVVKTP